MKILMLEDQEVKIEMIQKRCEDRGDEFTAVGTVEEFAELIHAGPYDVILLDHDLGYGKNGVHAVGCMCAEQGYRCRVYVHSGNIVEAPKMVKALREGLFRAYQIDFLSMWEGLKDPDWEW